MPKVAAMRLRGLPGCSGAPAHPSPSGITKGWQVLLSRASSASCRGAVQEKKKSLKERAA